jgi:hypothetical protein
MEPIRDRIGTEPWLARAENRVKRTGSGLHNCILVLKLVAGEGYGGTRCEKYAKNYLRTPDSGGMRGARGFVFSRWSGRGVSIGDCEVLC